MRDASTSPVIAAPPMDRFRYAEGCTHVSQQSARVALRCRRVERPEGMDVVDRGKRRGRRSPPASAARCSKTTRGAARPAPARYDRRVPWPPPVPRRRRVAPRRVARARATGAQARSARLREPARDSPRRPAGRCPRTASPVACRSRRAGRRRPRARFSWTDPSADRRRLRRRRSPPARCSERRAPGKPSPRCPARRAGNTPNERRRTRASQRTPPAPPRRSSACAVGPHEAASASLWVAPAFRQCVARRSLASAPPESGRRRRCRTWLRWSLARPSASWWRAGFQPMLRGATSAGARCCITAANWRSREHARR